MNDTWKQTDPTIKKKEANLEKYNSDLPTMQLCSIATPFCNYAASQRQTENVEHKWKAQNWPY